MQPLSRPFVVIWYDTKRLTMEVGKGRGGHGTFFVLYIDSFMSNIGGMLLVSGIKFVNQPLHFAMTLLVQRYGTVSMSTNAVSRIRYFLSTCRLR